MSTPNNDQSQPPKIRTPFRTNVTRCARCSGNHTGVEFKPFTNPPANSTHFALCPENGEPIICLAEQHGELPGQVFPVDAQPIGEKAPHVIRKVPRNLRFLRE